MISKRLQQVQPSVTLAVTQKEKELKDQGIAVLGFGAGEPDFDAPEHVKEAVALSLEENSTSKYTAAAGTPSLKRAIQVNIKAHYGLTYEPAQVVVGCGAKHVLYNIIQVICDVGDEIIIPAPYWVSYPEMVRLAGGNPVFVEASAEQNYVPSVEAIMAAVTPRTRGIIVNSPSNPTGALWPVQVMRDLLEALGPHEQVMIISDDIYDQLVYDGGKATNIATLDSDWLERIFLVNGVSKSYAMTGWRIGWVAGPKAEMKAIANLQSHSTSNPTTIAQIAAEAALMGPQQGVGEMRGAFEQRRNLMCALFDRIPGITYVKPDGAFYVFADFSAYYGKREGINDSLTMADYLLTEGHVAVVPGIAFGDDRCQRLSFACSEQRIEQGLAKIGVTLAKL
jgi:aspartate aminotransferase